MATYNIKCNSCNPQCQLNQEQGRDSVQGNCSTRDRHPSCHGNLA